jgi:NAD(P)-dependent dehydrogenase (short-subunit alcohol dehydrogenase family)
MPRIAQLREAWQLSANNSLQKWARDKGNVNVVAPTFVGTRSVEHMLADEIFYEELVARIPLGRIAELDDVSGAVLCLLRIGLHSPKDARRRHYRHSIRIAWKEFSKWQ